MSKQSHIATIPSATSSRDDEIFRGAALAHEASRLSKSNVRIDLHRLELELTLTMRKIPIGSSEGRRLFALRARVRQQLANGGEDIVFVAHRDQPNARMTEWALDQPAGGAA